MSHSNNSNNPAMSYIDTSFIFFFFLLSIEMVKGKGKSARQTRNVLLRMSSDKLLGPLNALKEWKVQRKRIKVSVCVCVQTKETES